MKKKKRKGYLVCMDQQGELEVWEHDKILGWFVRLSEKPFVYLIKHSPTECNREILGFL